MLARDALFRDLETIGLGTWQTALQSSLDDKLADRAHGDLPGWRRLIAGLPKIDATHVDLTRAAVTAVNAGADPAATGAMRRLLLRLTPWRKGPFDLFGVRIDAEWRSDRKWDRLRDSLAPLTGRNVLDVGAGNGYYALRMRGDGARFVLGVDPTLLYLVQFSAIQKYVRQDNVHVLPLRLQELPESDGAFDTTISMGVLYHQRAPLEHLAALRRTLRPGGELVLETLILPGTDIRAATPADRYARMRNVWLLPTLPQLRLWLDESGFSDCRVVDISTTRTVEQRTTEWMPFESLDKALDPQDPGKTIEGWPAPTRAIVLCNSGSEP